MIAGILGEVFWELVKYAGGHGLLWALKQQTLVPSTFAAT